MAKENPLCKRFSENLSFVLENSINDQYGFTQTTSKLIFLSNLEFRRNLNKKKRSPERIVRQEKRIKAEHQSPTGHEPIKQEVKQEPLFIKEELTEEQRDKKFQELKKLTIAVLNLTMKLENTSLPYILSNFYDNCDFRNVVCIEYPDKESYNNPDLQLWELNLKLFMFSSIMTITGKDLKKDFRYIVRNQSIKLLAQNNLFKSSS